MTHPAIQVNPLNGINNTMEENKIEYDLEKIRAPLFYHPTTNRASSAKILFKILGWHESLNGWCKISQKTISSRELMTKFDYSKNLTDRQVRRTLLKLCEAGLVTFKRSGNNRSVNQYKLTDLGWKAYDYFIKNPVRKISTESVDKKFAEKKCPPENEKMSSRENGKTHVFRGSQQKNVLYKYETNFKQKSSSSFNTKTHNGGSNNVSYQTKTDFTGAKSIIKETERAELTRSQKEIVEELCKGSGLDSKQTSIVIEDVAEQTYKIVKSGSYTKNFEGFARNVMNYTIETHYWTVKPKELSMTA